MLYETEYGKGLVSKALLSIMLSAWEAQILKVHILTVQEPDP